MKMHVSYFVNDVRASAAFYNDFFGTLPVKEKADYIKYELDSPGLVISFIQNPDKVVKPTGHLGLRVDTESQLAEYKQRLTEIRMPVREEMAVSCCYALQDKFWVTDPDGLDWEVYRFTEDVTDDLNGNAGACCAPTESIKKEVKSTCCEGEACGC